MSPVAPSPPVLNTRLCEPSAAAALSDSDVDVDVE
jgi:hypothetical protein